MRCQEISRKTPKCNCCDLCIQVRNSKCQKNNPPSDRTSHQTTNESYCENFAIPDDLYNCKENINRLKSYNERVLKILDDLMHRPCRIVQTSDCIGPSEDEDEDEVEQALQHLCQQKQHSQHQSHLLKQPHSVQHRSHSQHQPNSLQHQSYSQHQPRSQQQHSPSLQYQSHSQQHSSSLQHQSHLQQKHSQQHQLHQQEQCTPNSHSKTKLQVTSPSEKIQNLGYLPQSNFLKNLKRRTEINPNIVSGPLFHCGCANCIPDGIHYRTQIMCPCCKCHTVDYALQSTSCGRPCGHYSDVSSMHDPCTCFRTWRPSPCSGHFPDYQYEVLERGDEICGSEGEGYIQECLNDMHDGHKDKDPSKKKGKSGHVSRLDKRKRRSDRRKSKPDEKEGLPSEGDFSPSLKRPHPNSCERCWRYASPSRSPVNRPSQRFDPNYRRSHSEVNINSGSKGNISRSGSRYSSTNCVDFDPETKVHEVISADRSLTRIKSADNVKKSSPVRPTCPKYHKRTSKTKDDAEISRIKKDSDMASADKRKNRHQRSCIRSGESSKEVLRNDRQNPMPCSPSMFDKKSQRSNSKKSTYNHLSSSESCKENVKIKQGPSSACRIQAPDDYFDKRRAQSFDRNYLKDSLCIPPERMRTCCCSKPKTRTVNMNVMCDQPLLYQGERGCFPEVRGTFGISNNQENPLGFDKPCPKQDGTKAFFDIRPCVCSFKDLPQLNFREGLTHCCCQKTPVTVWNSQVISTDEGEIDKKRNSRKIRSKKRKDEESNPRKYCVFYMNKSEENEKDGIEVLIEELTEGRNGKDSKTESLKNKAKKMQEHRSDSMALRFQKGIAEKCRRR